jgi:hypothetical protein
MCFSAGFMLYKTISGRRSRQQQLPPPPQGTAVMGSAPGGYTAPQMGGMQQQQQQQQQQPPQMQGQPVANAANPVYAGIPGAGSTPSMVFARLSD